MRKLFVAYLFLLLLGAFQTPVLAQPDTVRIGAFINDIYDINLAEKSFSTSFWVWFNYTNGELNPMKSLEIPTAKEVRYNLGFSEIKNGLHWSGKQVHAIIKKDWDVRRFPFDEQTMRIDLEESNLDIKEMVYVADTENTKLDTGLIISNWTIERFELSTKIKKYDTTYGDPSLSNGSAYTHATLEVLIKRKSWGLFFSLFTGLYVSFFISTLVFFIDPIHVDPRFGLSVGALFAAVGNKYIVDSILPQSTTFTLVDKLHILTYVSLLFCIVLSVFSLHLWNKGEKARSLRFDRRSYFLIVVSYFLINIVLIYRSIHG